MLRAPRDVFAFLRVAASERVLVALTLSGATWRVPLDAARRASLALSTDPSGAAEQLNAPLDLAPNEGVVAPVG